MSVDLDKLTAPFPKEAIKQRQGGGGRMLSYVEGHTVIHRLNEATVNTWNMEVKSIETKPTPAGNLMIAHVALEIPTLGTREGLGVQLVSERGGEDLVKGCVTDGLKKAATLFGVGLELYGPDYEAGEIQRPSAPPAARSATPPAPQPRPTGQPAAPQGQIPPGQPPSEKQWGFLNGLMKAVGIEKPQMDELIQTRYAMPADQFDKRTLSHLIDALVSVRDGATALESLYARQEGYGPAEEPASVEDVPWDDGQPPPF